MPELPDVEVFRKYLNSTALHQKIDKVEVKEKSMLGKVSSRSLQMRLKGAQFESTLRHGKYLFAQTDQKDWLVLHFGMTGFLRYFKNPDEQPGHVRLLIHFKNEYKLAFDCRRKLGLIDLTEDADQFIMGKDLGIDPWRQELDLGKFKERLQGRSGAVKSALMNQQIFAGIGNIYSDEILYQSDVHPETPVNNLNEKQLKSLHSKMNHVLKMAIEKKADPQQMPQSWLLPRRKQGEKCPRCGGEIQKITVSGRSSYFCSKHQKAV
ncbi:MAG: DNA-formamidopyrimidine glycosylase family protein [Calditrichia bacterium]